MSPEAHAGLLHACYAFQFSWSSRPVVLAKLCSVRILGMDPRRHQFTVRRVLWATFWAASTCAAWKIGVETNGSDLAQPIQVGLRVFMFVGPCITAGELFGSAVLGAAIGLAVVIATMLLLRGITFFV